MFRFLCSSTCWWEKFYFLRLASFFRKPNNFQLKKALVTKNEIELLLYNKCHHSWKHMSFACHRNLSYRMFFDHLISSAWMKYLFIKLYRNCSWRKGIGVFLQSSVQFSSVQFMFHPRNVIFSYAALMEAKKNMTKEYIIYFLLN